MERLEKPSGDTAVSTYCPSSANTSLWPGKYTPTLSAQGEGQVITTNTEKRLDHFENVQPSQQVLPQCVG